MHLNDYTRQVKILFLVSFGFGLAVCFFLIYFLWPARGLSVRLAEVYRLQDAWQTRLAINGNVIVGNIQDKGADYITVAALAYDSQTDRTNQVVNKVTIPSEAVFTLRRAKTPQEILGKYYAAVSAAQTKLTKAATAKERGQLQATIDNLTAQAESDRQARLKQINQQIAKLDADKDKDKIAALRSEAGGLGSSLVYQSFKLADLQVKDRVIVTVAPRLSFSSPLTATKEDIVR